MTQEPTPAPDDWLTVEQAAGAYQCSARTIRRQIDSGKLEAVKVTVTGQGRWEWRIRPPLGYTLPPPDPTEAPRPRVVPGQPEPPSLAIMRQVEEYRQIVAVTRQDLERAQAERAALAERLEALHAQYLADVRNGEEARRADAEELGRLRGRLEALEAELARARQLSPNNPPAPVTDRPRRRWPWSR